MNAKSWVVAFATATLLIFTSGTAVAAAIPAGDVVTGSLGPPVGFSISGDLGVIHAGNGSYTQLQNYPFPNGGGVRAVGVSPTGLIYVGENLSNNLQMAVFDASGTRTGVLAPGGFLDVTFDRAGNIYAAAGAVFKFSASGQSIATFAAAVPGASSLEGVDLAADQCTLFYTTTGSATIKKFDVCRNLQLPDFASILGEQLKPIRILPDGSVAVGGLSAVYRLATSGQILQQYQPAGNANPYKGLAVALDGHSIWIASSATATCVDFQSGTILQGPFGGPAQEIQSLAVVGEPRAALGLAGIPMFSALGSLGLLAALAAVACVRLS